MDNFLSYKLADSGGKLVAAKSEAEYIQFFRNYSGRDGGCFTNGSGQESDYYKIVTHCI